MRNNYRKKVNPNMTVKELVTFMEKHGMCKYELADTLGVTVQGVNLWLKGEREISLTVTRVIKMFNKYPVLIKEFREGSIIV